MNLQCGGLARACPESRVRFITWQLYGRGPLYLQQDSIARLVAGSIRFGAEHLHYYELCAYVVMADHVHLLVRPWVDSTRFLQTVKDYTAREANRMLGRIGRPFWRKESADHWLADAREADRIKACIENEPLRAGLAARPEDYLWSSAAGSKAWMPVLVVCNHQTESGIDPE